VRALLHVAVHREAQREIPLGEHPHEVLLQREEPPLGLDAGDGASPDCDGCEREHGESLA
jgi:hypothetical protein